MIDKIKFGVLKPEIVRKMAAAKISEREGMLDNKSVQMITDTLTRYSLPAHCRGITPDALLEAVRFDKKVTQGEIRWVLLERIGCGVINCIVEESIVKEVLGEVCQ